jgi:hypothetical protein
MKTQKKNLTIGNKRIKEYTSLENLLRNMISEIVRDRTRHASTDVFSYIDNVIMKWAPRIRKIKND